MKFAAHLVPLLALVLTDPVSPPETWDAIIDRVDDVPRTVELPRPTLDYKNDSPQEQKILHSGIPAPVSLNVQISGNYFEALVPPSRKLVARPSGRNACATAQANIVFDSRLSPVRQQAITRTYLAAVQEGLEHSSNENGSLASKMVRSTKLVLADPVSPPETQDAIIDRAEDGPRTLELPQEQKIVPPGMPSTVGSTALVLADPVNPPETREAIIDRAEDGPRTVELPPPTFDYKNDSPQEQKILHPVVPATARIKAPRAINPEARAFGKLVDCAPLQPGDLLLSQELHPDVVSKVIAKVQLNGGYSEQDAQWTYAAMYLGDGVNVIEATFDSVFSSGSVRITSLDHYCQGKYALRFRRSKHVLSAQNGWLLCIRALTRLKQPYSFAHAAKLWWDVVIRKCGFHDAALQRPTSKATICSML
jgi:hypothetical protein